jgi:NADH-quinone oxidoreductase subunit N
MPPLTVDDWVTVLPALSLIGAALLVVALDAGAGGERRRGAGELAAYAGLLVALGVVIVRLWKGADLKPLTGFGQKAAPAVVLDNLSLFLSLAILAATGLTVVLSADVVRRRPLPHGEYHGLILLSAAGMILLVQSLDFVTFFVSLEILSLAVYALAGLFRRDPRSTEASVKYFVIGAFATGFLLYGMTLLYGATGALSLDRIGIALDAAPAERLPLATAGMALVVIGLCFKVGAAPFHAWVPDVYEGAPTSVTAFMSVAVKAAGFGAFLRVLLTAGFAERQAWGDLLFGVAIATMVLGNFLAVWQRSVKRMLAYSSIAHTGYVLVAVTALRQGTAGAKDAAAGAVFYLFVYTFMTLGAFAFVIYAGRGDRDAEDLEDYAGLARRKPWAALLMAVFMVSLAGLPPTAGFFGKFLIFKAAIAADEVWLVVIGVLTSAVSVYYYLRVVVAMYMRPDPEATEVATPAPNAGWVVLAAAFFTVALGLVPGRFVSLAYQSVQGLLPR